MTLPHSEQHLVGHLRAEVAGDLAEHGAHVLAMGDRRELARRITLTRLRDRADEMVASGAVPLDAVEEQQVVRQVLDALFGLGRLQELVDDCDIENIDVNGCDEIWVTYASGDKVRWGPVADSDDDLIEILRSAAARLGLSERRFDTAHPELDLRLPDGSRLSALMAVTARPAVSIRRHRFVDLDLQDLVRLGAMDPTVADFLAAAVRARKNLVIGGAMNSGKTTLARALASEIPPHERVVTIEQALELGLERNRDRFPDVVALEAREPNAEGEGEVSMARLVRRAVRMNADRVIVGEVLGDEVLPMLNAMGQGRAGSLCTIHADSSMGIFRRLATYAVQSSEHLPLESTSMLIAGAVHLAAFVDVSEEPAPIGVDPRPDRFHRVRRHRFVSSVRQVVDADGIQVVTNEIFRPGPDGRAVPGAPMTAELFDQLAAHGYQPMPFDLSRAGSR